MKHENLYRRGNAWYYRFKMHGRDTPYRGSCFTHRLDEAKKVLRQKMAEAEAQPTAATVATSRHVSLDALKAWDIRRATLLGSKTIETTVVTFWDRLARMFSHAGEITADTLANYASTMLDRGYKPQTIKRDLQAAVRAYEWAADRDPTLPRLGKLAKLKSAPVGKRKGVPVPLDKVEPLLSALKRPARIHATIFLMTGLRFTEFRRVLPAWFVVSKGEHFLCLPEGLTKNGKARRIGLDPALHALMIEALPFAVDYRKAWATASKRAGLAKAVMARDLRHTFASTMAPFDSHGVDLVMGHQPGQSGSSTRYYQHGDDERLAKLARATFKTLGFALHLCTA